MRKAEIFDLVKSFCRLRYGSDGPPEVTRFTEDQDPLAVHLRGLWSQADPDPVTAEDLPQVRKTVAYRMIEREAAKLWKAGEAGSLPQAVVLVIERRPELYRRHVREAGVL